MYFIHRVILPESLHDFEIPLSCPPSVPAHASLVISLATGPMSAPSTPGHAQVPPQHHPPLSAPYPETSPQGRKGIPKTLITGQQETYLKQEVLPRTLMARLKRLLSALSRNLA